MKAYFLFKVVSEDQELLVKAREALEDLGCEVRTDIRSDRQYTKRERRLSLLNEVILDDWQSTKAIKAILKGRGYNGSQKTLLRDLWLLHMKGSVEANLVPGGSKGRKILWRCKNEV